MAMPERPKPSYIETPDISVGKAIGKLTSKDEVIEMLGNLDNDEDIARLSLYISLGSDIDTKISWLKEYAYTELALTNSLRTKIGGIRSEHLVKITKQSDMMLPPQEGIIARLRGKFSR